MKRFKNILYVANPSGVVLTAFHHAVGLAERNDARLTVILVMERMPVYLTRLTPHMLRQARARELQAALDRLCKWAAGRVQIEARIIEGKPFLEIIREVLRHERDLVIKSADGDAGTVGRLFGTTDMHLLRKCPCPVWLIRSTGPTPIRSTMACVDFDDLDPPDEDRTEPLNRMILELAGSLAFLEHSDCHVVHAWDAPGDPLMRSVQSRIDEEEADNYVNEVCLQHHRWLDRLLRKARTWLGPETYDAVRPKIHVPRGPASEVVPRIAGELQTDLVVMGTVARTGIPGFIIGNTAESVLYQISCSVLAVKPPDFATPVTLED